MAEAPRCANTACRKPLPPGALLAPNDRYYCSYTCAATDRGIGQPLPGPAFQPQAN